MDIAQLHFAIGWGAMLLGVVAGAVMGLQFHREGWAGGYGSFRRRMLRLGHIAFFGIGMLNLLFGLTVKGMELSDPGLLIASTGFGVAAVAMPLCCFLTAWRTPFRHLFPIPVLAVLAGILPIVFGG